MRRLFKRILGGDSEREIDRENERERGISKREWEIGPSSVWEKKDTEAGITKKIKPRFSKTLGLG